MSAVVEHTQPQQHSLLAKFASRFGVEPNKMLATLKATAFKGDVSNEQMMALLIVADQHGLNPWTKEIYAFPDKSNGIVPVVGVDGWARIINSHPQFDGMEFEDGEVGKDGLPVWIECVIHRKDRSHAIRAREYMAECKRNTGPWGSHPRRMLRHKAMIQCARLAFSYTGIYDQDEAERIVEMGEAQIVDPAPAVADLNKRLAAKRAAATDAKVSESIEPSEPDPQPTEDLAPVTYAQVAAAINKAKSADTLDVACDLIGEVADEGQRGELAELAAQRREKLQA